MKRETPSETCNASFIRLFHACHLGRNADGELVLSPIGHPHEMEVGAAWYAAELRAVWPRERYGTVRVLVWKN